MKKLLCLCAGVLAMSVACMAADQPPVPGAGVEKKHGDRERGTRPEMKDLTLTGTVTKQDVKTLKGETVPGYVLTTEDGTVVRLPGRDKDMAAKLDGFVGVKVKVVGSGYMSPDKKRAGLRSITSIEKAGDAAAAPAAVPAPAPAQ